MKTVELFSGTGSFSKVALKLGHQIYRVEIREVFEAEKYKDILKVRPRDLPGDVDVLWASPPCTSFSIAGVRKHWTKTKFPKSSDAALGMAYVLKTLELISEIKPKYWFIENPRGMLRKIPFMQDHIRRTVTYCQYGDERMKPTDIWTNCLAWMPRPMCKNGDPCHISTPRGSSSGTQGVISAWERAIIPPALFEEIFLAISNGGCQKTL